MQLEPGDSVLVILEPGKEDELRKILVRQPDKSSSASERAVRASGPSRSSSRSSAPGPASSASIRLRPLRDAQRRSG